MSIHEIPFDNNCTMPDETFTNTKKTDKQIMPKKRKTVKKRKAVKKRKKITSRAYCSICMKYFATQGSRKVHMMNIHHDNEIEQSTSSISPLNSCTEPLDQPIESNELDISEEVDTSIPKGRTSNRMNTRSSGTKNFSTPGSCKTHMKDCHGNTVSNNCELEIPRLFKKSLNPSTEPNPDNILKEVSENQNKTKNQMKRKNNKKYPCGICKKKFSTMKLYKIHTTKSSCHNNEVSEELVINKPFRQYLPQIQLIEEVNEDLFIKNEIFREFENEMPLEFLHDNEKFRCNICNTITTDIIGFMDHEKMHYQNIVNIEYDMFGKIICNSCQCVFTEIDYEEHKHDCTNIDYKISKLRNAVPIAQIKNEDLDLLPNDSKIIVLAKDSEVLNEEHVKVLKSFQLVQQTFECLICQKTCDKLEHLECHQWWSSSD